MTNEFREFEWPRLHITDDHFEEQIYNKAEEYVFDFYNVMSLTDLTENEIESVKVGLGYVISAAENTENGLE